MMENSGLSKSQPSVADGNNLSDQEMILLVMFRAISTQRQSDVLRLLEVLALTTE